MSTLLRLPTELLNSICGLCQPGDIQNLRLTCRAVKDVASEHLISQVSTYYHEADLDRLLEIVKAPAAIRHSIRSLHCRLDLVHTTWPTFDDWDTARVSSYMRNKRYIQDHQRQEPTNNYNSFTPSASDSARDGLNVDNVNDDKPMEDNDDGDGKSDYELLIPEYDYSENKWAGQSRHQDPAVRETMATFFSACPNLSMLHFECRPRSDVTLAVLEGTLQPSQVFPHGLRREQVGQCLQDTLLAASDSRKVIKSLHVAEILDCWTGLRPTEELSSIMHAVEDLSLEFGREHITRDTNEWLKDVKAINYIMDNSKDYHINLLRAATKLKVLNLSWSLPEGWGHNRIDLKDLVGALHWPHLERLVLGRFKTSLTDLVSLLYRHRDTLQSFELWHAHLSDEGWDICFEALAGALPQLKDVRFEGDFKSATGSWYFFAEQNGTDRNDREHALWVEYLRDGGLLPRQPDVDHDSDLNSDYDQGLESQSESSGIDWGRHMVL